MSLPIDATPHQIKARYEEICRASERQNDKEGGEITPDRGLLEEVWWNYADPALRRDYDTLQLYCQRIAEEIAPDQAPAAAAAQSQSPQGNSSKIFATHPITAEEEAAWQTLIPKAETSGKGTHEEGVISDQTSTTSGKSSQSKVQEGEQASG
ncbi:MAG: hypothetical protein Q9166_006852 [cf. Caloplaca sp. 2 TL-2023]